MQRSKAIRSPDVAAAFSEVPRETFVPEIAKDKGLATVYDQWAALVTKVNQYNMPLSSSTAPNLMAQMLEALDLRPGQRVLEVGTGTGYNAALLSRLVGTKGKVVSIEIDPDIARTARQNLKNARAKAKVVVGDGREGWVADAPFDRIIVTAHAKTVPRKLVDQLASDGLLQIPLMIGVSQIAQFIPTLSKAGGSSLESVNVVAGGFMALRDQAGDSYPMTGMYIGAFEVVDGKESSLAGLYGVPIQRANQTERALLLRMVLEPKEPAPLGFRGGENLFTYLTLAAEDDLISGWLNGHEVVGIVELGPPSLALIPVRYRNKRPTLSHIVSFGHSSAGKRIQQLIKEWEALGRPSSTDMSVRVSFSTRPPRRKTWRRKRLESCWLDIDVKGAQTRSN